MSQTLKLLQGAQQYVNWRKNGQTLASWLRFWSYTNSSSVILLLHNGLWQVEEGVKRLNSSEVSCVIKADQKSLVLRQRNLKSKIWEIFNTVQLATQYWWLK